MDDIDLEPLGNAAASAVVGASAGGIRQTRSVGAVNIDSPFRIASLSKSVTAVAAVRAVQHAGLSLDTPVLDLLCDLRDDWVADQQLTIADVLSQTSGLAATVSADTVARLGDGDTVCTEAARMVVRAGSARPPGRSWEYYKGNYFLAGEITATLARTTFECAVEDLVLRPWDLTATSFTPPSNLTHGIDHGKRLPVSDYPRARRPSGGLCSTAGDLLNFGEHLLHADLLTHIRTVRTRLDDPVRYGLGVAIGPSGQLFLNGRLPGYRTALMLVPDYDLVAVTLAADSSALLPATRILSDLQLGLTGDDLTETIDLFAA